MIDTSIHVTSLEKADWNKIHDSGAEYTTNYQWYTDNNSQLNNWLLSGTKLSTWFVESSSKLSEAGGITLEDILDVFYPSSLGKAVSSQSSAHVDDTTIHVTSTDKDKWNDIYASGTYYTIAYNHSQDNTQAHTDYLLNNESDSTTGTITAAGFKTAGGISGNISGSWTVPLYPSLTAAGTAVNRPGQIITTSGNANGTWVWISIYGGSTWNWMQLSYLSGV